MGLVDGSWLKSSQQGRRLKGLQCLNIFPEIRRQKVLDANSPGRFPPHAFFPRCEALMGCSPVREGRKQASLDSPWAGPDPHAILSRAAKPGAAEGLWVQPFWQTGQSGPPEEMVEA